LVFGVVSRREVRYRFRQVCFGDNVKVLAVIVGIGNVKARGAERERFGDLWHRESFVRYGIAPWAKYRAHPRKDRIEPTLRCRRKRDPPHGVVEGRLDAERAVGSLHITR
jgi:hypothetical protein